jgi:hypothetical protein
MKASSFMGTQTIGFGAGSAISICYVSEVISIGIRDAMRRRLVRVDTGPVLQEFSVVRGSCR